jgi:hypothetical protein
MIKTTRHILKADEVAFEDPLQLGLDPAQRPHAAEAPGAQAGPSVRIAENHPDHAVIEITCACGKTTYIRCEYASSARPTPSQNL